MSFTILTIFGRVARLVSRSTRLRIALFSVIACLSSITAALAVQYDFLTVSGNGIGGNAATSQFMSSNGNGVISVSHSFSAPAGAGSSDNINTAIFPSQFTTLFPGTGQVQGHLAQTVYNYQSVITFDLTGYNLSPTTVFGMWNTTDEVTASPGGPYVYQVQLIDAGNVQVNPTSFNLIGNQNNQTQVQARHQLVMNTSTGEITFGATLNPSGTHTDAAFWDNIPAGTKKIIVYGDLPPLNTIGDGVGYYFAEVVPEPASGAVSACGLLSLGVLGRRRPFAQRLPIFAFITPLPIAAGCSFFSNGLRLESAGPQSWHGDVRRESWHRETRRIHGLFAIHGGSIVQRFFSVYQHHAVCQ